MELSTTELQQFRDRCLRALVDGHRIAHSSLYVAALEHEAKVSKGFPGSPEHLLALTDAVLAIRSGTKPRVPKDPEPVPSPPVQPPPVESPTVPEEVPQPVTVPEPKVQVTAVEAPPEKTEELPSNEETPPPEKTEEKPAAEGTKEKKGKKGKR